MPSLFKASQVFELRDKSHLSVRQRPENKLHLQGGLWPDAQCPVSSGQAMFELQGKSYLSVRQRPENKLHLQDGLWPNAQPLHMTCQKSASPKATSEARTSELSVAQISALGKQDRQVSPVKEYCTKRQCSQCLPTP